MTRTALRVRPRRLIRHVTHEREHVPEEALSLDELIAGKFQEVIDQANQIEDPQMRELWLDAMQTFVTTGDAQALVDVCKWRRPVVPLDEFLFGEAYLKLKENELFQGVTDALYDLDTDKYDEAVLMGGLGIGKTTIGNIATIRDIYKISCMRNPHDTYGIQTGTQIGWTIQSVRLGTAKKVVFDELGRYIRNSAYFQQKFPYDPYVLTELKFKQFNLKVMPISSSTTGVISMNVLGGQLDEMNFQQKTLHSKSQHADEKGMFDQAKQLYTTLANRRKSRFINRGNLPGTLFIISSSRFPDDFTEEKARESAMRGGKDERIYVYHHSRWSVAPSQFGTQFFQVQVGNSTFPSRILEEGQQPDGDCRVIEVPEEFRDEFERNVDEALRDIAGETTLSTHPFITQRQYIAKAMESAKTAGYLPIFAQEQYELSVGLPMPDEKLIRTDVDMWRHCHIDLGLKKDACGVAIGHIAGYKVSMTKDQVTGKEHTDIAPVIAYDMIMRVIPPRGGEIQISDIRKLLIRLRNTYKLPIKYVTLDGFQSVDTRQILFKKGFITDYLSVESAESYRTLKDALYGERVLMPQHHFVSKELADLEQTVKNNKEKVDHRPNGSKDVADAVCGVANFLLSRKVAWQSISLLGGQEGVFLLGDKSWQDLKEEYGSDTATETNDAPNSSRPATNRRVIERRKSIARK